MLDFPAFLSRLASNLEPIPPEAIAANRRAWNRLPDRLRHERQTLGVQSAGCAATVGVMEACDFYCTACYLPASSQETPPLPFDEVKKQVDQIADYYGPTGNIQLTAGEVSLLPREELGRIVQYCLERQLTPMVMTNGQTMLRDPSYLEHLMECGLTKVAIHVDTTQRGRDGMNNSDREVDLHWIRDEFADLIRHMRQKTGRTLHAAHTFTVTQENQEELPEVIRWSVDNADAFRLISLQPTAEVGRTRIGRQGGDVISVWDRVCEGAKRQLNPNGSRFGHEKCNTMSMNFVVKFDGETRLVEFLQSKKDVRFLHKLLRKGFGAYTPFDESLFIRGLKALILLGQRPNWLWDLPAYLMHRMSTEREWTGRFIKAALTGKEVQINPYAIVVHNFMSADELLTPAGKERLDACSFRVPFNGKMVSMCEFNGADMREANNQVIMDSGDGPAPKPKPRAPRKPTRESVLV